MILFEFSRTLEKLGLSDEQVDSVANVPVEFVQTIGKKFKRNVALLQT
jgi:tetrahydromethanopterin S-methyltransferase subunit G